MDLTQLADLLFAPIPLPAGLATSPAEVAGFTFGVATVWLAARNSAWTWPVGILNNAFWIALFLSVALYADAGLQVVYIAMSVYGTWHWLRGGPQGGSAPVTRAGAAGLLPVAAVSVAGCAALAWGLDTLTDSTTPIPDAFTTVASLAANWLLARRHVETWPLWILGVNVPFIGLYLAKGLALTAALQLVFIALSVAGWRRWLVELRGEALPATAAA